MVRVWGAILSQRCSFAVFECVAKGQFSRPAELTHHNPQAVSPSVPNPLSASFLFLLPPPPPAQAFPLPPVL